MSRLDPKYVKAVLTDFGETVKRAAKLNLLPGSLKESIDYDLTFYEKTRSFTLAFVMKEYGLFQDRGVSGTQEKYRTKFTFKNKQPPSKALKPWVLKNRIRFRDSGGRFVRGKADGIAYVIARSIKRKGIKPTGFFSRPFANTFRELPDEVTEAYGLTIDQTLDTWLVGPNYTGPNVNVKKVKI